MKLRIRKLGPIPPTISKIEAIWMKNKKKWEQNLRHTLLSKRPFDIQNFKAHLH